ncbi:MAG: DUF4234 domain-containing protein [Elusimicrobia bacterium]|nr:DUF4234 domain-containing protein [Elusimicrobiota bacterium]MDE2509525.1 DUF4234 domain-containing protein [Elusimicrobiota bacterium]
MTDAKPLASEHRIDVAAGIIFSVISCGIYNIYWNYRQMVAMNALLGRHEFDFGKWALLTLFSCGLYHIYYEYRMGTELHQWLVQNDRVVNPNLATIGLALSVFGLTVLADAVYQSELNKLT